MGHTSIYRKIFSNTAIYGAGIMIGKLSSFLLLPLYTRYLTPADYGVLELVELSFFVVLVVGMRIGDAFCYFYFRAGTEEGRRRVLSTAILGSAAVGVAATAVFWVLAGKISLLMLQTTGYEFYFRLMFAALTFSFLQDIGFCYFRALDRAGTFVVLTTVKLALTIVLNVMLLVWYRMGIAAMLWSSVAASAATALALAAYCLSRTRFVFDLGLFRQFCRYGTPVAASGLGLLFMHYADRIFLQRYASLSEVGIYSLGYKIGMLAAYVWASFGSYWSAQMFDIVKRPNGEAVYVRTFTYFTLGVTYAALALSVFAHPIVAVMATPAFAGAAFFIAPVAAAYAIKGMDDYIRSVFLIEKKTLRNAWVTWVGVAMCFALYMTLVPRFKSWGAVAATFASFAAMGLLAFFEAQRVRAFAFEYGRLARITVCALAVFGASIAVHPAGVAAQAGLGLVLLLAFPFLLCASGFCDGQETKILKAALGRLRRGRAPAGVIGAAVVQQPGER